VEYEYASPKQMERMSHLRTPTDILALVEIPRRRTDPAAFGRELTLALDGVQDPGNLGTIIRLADWFGVRDIICSRDTADCFNPKVVQATMGAITRVRVHYGELEEWLGAATTAAPAGKPAPGGKFAKTIVPVYGTFLDGENIHSAKLTPTSGIIVMGSEGRGISPEIEKQVSRRLYIPHFPPDAPTAESLNVATATAITLAEFRRR
jgi:TrmH family RNA methyltransferase